jgi:hypothetical protein
MSMKMGDLAKRPAAEAALKAHRCASLSVHKAVQHVAKSQKPHDVS